ncbi:MAG: arginine--tRNA ligase, partial [Mycobacteriales bacterium]
MSLAKRLGKPPREVAQQLLEALKIADLTEPPTIGGPGFINFTFGSDWLSRYTTALADDQRLGVPLTTEPRRVVIDLSGPNVAKEMHVGHLRSTIIGSALARILAYIGYEVIPQNHLGDWGTPFGMLLEYTRELGWDHSALAAASESTEKHSIADLNAFYRQARARFDSDAAFADRARQRVVALQGGDEASLTLWRAFITESQRHFSQVYQLLGVELTPADARGESFYNPMLPVIAAELEQRGIARISDGALCAFPDGFTGADDEPLPLMVRKSDGGYTYDTTDLAALRFRVEELTADQLIYVVGGEQRLHFAMVFAVARQAGWLPTGVLAQHVGFGMLLGENGKRFRTRSGETVKLIDLVTEAVERAAQVVSARSDLSAAQQAEVARQVGTGAVKYGDLASDRERDYTFSWSRMLAMEGNTSVYLQYANARIRSVLRRVARDTHGAVVLTEPAERALALSLARFAPAVVATAETLQPHRLCVALYEIATEFSRFYESCSI